jgi:hypothetical protein
MIYDLILIGFVLAVSITIIFLSAYFKKGPKPIRCPKCKGAVFYNYRVNGSTCENCQRVYTINECLELIRKQGF